MHIIDVASTFRLSVTDAEFIMQGMVDFLEKFRTGTSGTLCLKRQQIVIVFLVCLEISPIDMTSDADTFLLVVDAVLLCQLVEPYVLAVHLHLLEYIPQVVHCLA